ncbi:MAG: hypothetical protein IJX91_03530 [Clostridia bacterium]|nr:hypothetical protein [Clostridia bacterium]
MKTRNKWIVTLALLCVTLFTLAGCKLGFLNKIQINAPESLAADFGTVYEIPDVTATYGEKTTFATPTVVDGNGNPVLLSDGAFFVADEKGYTVNFTATFGEKSERSGDIKISVSLDKNAPQINMPLQREYKVKTGATFTLPEVTAYDSYDDAKGKESSLGVAVYRGETEIALNEGGFVVEKKGLYEVVYTAENSLGKKTEQSILVYGDDRYDNLFANFEDEYAGIDVASFTTGDRAAIYTPATLNTDVKYTHNASGGSLKVAKQTDARYVTLYYTPNLTHENDEALKFTFWMYLDKIKTDTNLRYLRLKVTSRNAADEFKAVDVYSLGSLAGKGGEWIPCSFTVGAGMTGPFDVSLFHGGVNDIGVIDFDVYFDDFAVAPVAQNTLSAYKLNLEEGQTQAEIDLSFIKNSVTMKGGEEFELSAFNLNTGAAVEIAEDKLVVAKDSPVALKYLKEGVQALETSVVYATSASGETSGANTIAWDDPSILTLTSGGERISAANLPDGVTLPSGVTSVYKLYKEAGNSAKPSLKFIGNGNNFIYPLTKLKFSVYVSEDLWVPNLGTDDAPDYQSCPFGFDGFAAETGKGLPVVSARWQSTGAAVGRKYQSGTFYLNTKDMKGQWVDVEIDFSSALFTDLAGLSVWFNNYHSPDHAAEADPAGYDSYVLLTDISMEYDNQSPVIGNADVSSLDGQLQAYDYYLPEITTTDNVSAANGIYLYSFLTCNGKTVAVDEEGGFVAKYAGEYVWKIFAVDEFGNYALQTKAFTIEANKAILSDGDWSAQEIFAGYEFEALGAVAYNAEGENVAGSIEWKIYDENDQERASSEAGEKVTLAKAGKYTIVYNGDGLEEKTYEFTVKTGIVWKNDNLTNFVKGVDEYGASNDSPLPAQLSVETIDGQNSLKVQYNQEFFSEENVAAAKRSFPGIQFVSDAGYTVTQNTVVTFRVRLSDNFAYNTSNCGVFLIYEGVSSTYAAANQNGLLKYANVSSQGAFADSGSTASDYAIRYVQGTRVKGYNIFANNGGQNWVDVSVSFAGIENPTLSGLKILFNTSHDTTNGSSVYSKYTNDKNSWFYISNVTITENA